MDQLIQILSNAEWTTILAVAGMLWIFNGHLSKKFDKMEQKFETRFDKLEEKVMDIDRRLCRLEGAFSSKDCCVLKNDQNLRKAE